ncbi:MAG: hypothetical protein ACK5H1_05490 [Tenacibaculum sp.]
MLSSDDKPFTSTAIPRVSNSNYHTSPPYAVNLNSYVTTANIKLRLNLLLTDVRRF